MQCYTIKEVGHASYTTPCRWESGVRRPTRTLVRGRVGVKRVGLPLGRFLLMAQTTGCEQATLQSMVTRRAEYPEVQNGAKIIAFSTNHMMHVQPPLAIIIRKMRVSNNIKMPCN